MATATATISVACCQCTWGIGAGPNAILYDLPAAPPPAAAASYAAVWVWPRDGHSRHATAASIVHRCADGSTNDGISPAAALHVICAAAVSHSSSRVTGRSIASEAVNVCSSVQSTQHHSCRLSCWGQAATLSGRCGYRHQPTTPNNFPENNSGFHTASP